MSTVVLVEIQSVNGAVYLFVLQNALGTVAERDYRHSVGTNGYCGGDVVHLSV